MRVIPVGLLEWDLAGQFRSSEQAGAYHRYSYPKGKVQFRINSTYQEVPNWVSRKVYVFDPPGGIGHSETPLVPSMTPEFIWRIPCQWILVLWNMLVSSDRSWWATFPLSCILLMTVTDSVSPQPCGVSVGTTHISIQHTGMNSWPRILAVDRKNRSLKSIRSHGSIRNLQCIL